MWSCASESTDRAGGRAPLRPSVRRVVPLLLSSLLPSLWACPTPGPGTLSEVVLTPTPAYPDSFFRATTTPAPDVEVESVRCTWLLGETSLQDGPCELDGLDSTLAPGDVLRVDAFPTVGGREGAAAASNEVTVLDPPQMVITELAGGSLAWVDSATGTVTDRTSLVLTDDDIDLDGVTKATDLRGLPMKVGFTPEGDTLNVSSSAYGVLWTVDPVSHEVLDWHQLSRQIYWFLYTDDPNRMLITDMALETDDTGLVGEAEGGVAEVDRTTFAETRSVVTGVYPIGLTEDADGRLFVPHHHSPTVAVVDGSTLELVAQLGLPYAPYFATIAPDGQSVWIACETLNAVVVYALPDLELVEVISVGKLPNYVAFNDDGSRAYVTNFRDGTISLIDVAASREVGTLVTGIGAVSIQHRPDRRYLYVGNVLERSMTVIDAVEEKVVAEWSALEGPRWIEWLP